MLVSVGGLIAAIYLGAKGEADKILSNGAEYEVIMKLDSAIVCTSENYIFIGRTKSYLFFYNMSNEFADVIATSSVKEFAIRKHIAINKTK